MYELLNRGGHGTSWRVWGFLAALVAAGVGCGGGGGSTTAIDLTVEADDALMLDTVDIAMRAIGKDDRHVSRPSARKILLRIVTEGLGAGAVVNLDVSGVKNKATVVLARAQAVLIRGGVVSVAVRLTAACVGILSCMTTETCTNGMCVSIPTLGDAGAGGAATGGQGTGGIGTGGMGTGGAATGGAGIGGAATGGQGTGGMGTGGMGTGGMGTGGMGTGGMGTGGRPDAGIDSPDASCPATSVELCFNGIDDNCDGLIDCRDPTCAPVAVCVPINGASPLGTTIPVDSTCPIGFQSGSPTVIHQGVTGGASCDGCVCSVSSHCSTTLRAYPSTTACTGTPVALASLDETSKCVPLPSGHSGVPHVDTFAYSATCSGTGTAQPSTWTWATTMKFCPADPPGKGCTAGFSCVHRNSAAYCTLGSGGCDAGFTARAGGIWYATATDSRQCGACGCQVATSGRCSSSRVLEHPANECAVTNPSSFVLLEGDRCDGFGETASFETADLSVTYDTVGTCRGTSAMAGTVTPTGAQTLCCQ